MFLSLLYFELLISNYKILTSIREAEILINNFGGANLLSNIYSYKLVYKHKIK